MTDKEKLQKLFQAALQDSSDGSRPLTRAFPEVKIQAAAAVAPAPAPVATYVPVPAPVAVVEPEPENLVRPMENAGLDDAASRELGILLDEQNKRLARKRRRQTLVTLLVCFGMTGGGYGWFVQSPQRVQAFKDAIRDVRSVGDVKSMVEKYRKALDRVAARSQQIDQATAAMGVKKSAADDVDPYFQTEMKQMMGKDGGKTIGERNSLMQKNFGQMEKKHDVSASKPGPSDSKKDEVAKTAVGESFEWQQNQP